MRCRRRHGQQPLALRTPCHRRRDERSLRPQPEARRARPRRQNWTLTTRSSHRLRPATTQALPPQTICGSSSTLCVHRPLPAQPSDTFPSGLLGPSSPPLVNRSKLPLLPIRQTTATSVVRFRPPGKALGAYGIIGRSDVTCCCIRPATLASQLFRRGGRACRPFRAGQKRFLDRHQAFPWWAKRTASLGAQASNQGRGSPRALGRPSWDCEHHLGNQGVISCSPVETARLTAASISTPTPTPTA